MKKIRTDKILAVLESTIQTLIESHQAGGISRKTLFAEIRPLTAAKLLVQRSIWQRVKDGLPDSDTTVMVALRNSDEPVWLGYHDGEQWRDVDGGIFKHVTHWKDICYAA